MISRIKSRHIFLVLGVAVVLGFQNCSAPVADQAGSTDTASSYEDTLPFAYAAKVDTIAHMSCSRVTNYDPRALFSFKAGALTSAGGLGLTPEFVSATSAFTMQERAGAFGASKLNANSLMQLSIRSSADYQSVWQSIDIRQGEELEAFLPELESSDVAGHLAAQTSGQLRNYFSSGNSQRLMEANLRYFDSEISMTDTRTSLANKASLMVLGYTNSASVLDTKLRGPAGTTAKNIFGTGFFIDFKVPSGYSAGERRAINSITEMDLKTGSNVAVTWDCSNSYQFMVIRPEDIAAGRVTCFTGADRYNSADPLQLPRLQAIRRVLRAEDWYVDVANRCVVPKTSADQCYGDRTGRPAVSYSTTTCTGDSCPHYVTVCLRK